MHIRRYCESVRLKIGTAQHLVKTQNYWDVGLFSLSGILEKRNMTFRKLNLFSFSDEGGKTPIQLGHFERAKLNHWISSF
jgi:hypothetical protein